MGLTEGRRGEDLRGSTPVLTARDVLLELRDDVREMKRTVDVLASQNLDSRVSKLESAQWRIVGVATGASAVVTFLLSSGVLNT